MALDHKKPCLGSRTEAGHAVTFRRARKHLKIETSGTSVWTKKP
jgi:hypothetical protein